MISRTIGGDGMTLTQGSATMPLDITGRSFDPSDPDDRLAQLVDGRDTSQESADIVEPWVAPDYASIPGDADVPLDEDERTLVWPGPPMIMPAGLLPDGRSYGRDERANASRICGEPVTSGVEADVTVRAYMRQQRALRLAAGLAIARRINGKLEDSPETLEAIRELHRAEQARRDGAGRRD